ncbi:MAG: hypothetical protein ABSA77_03260 [Thermoguttaceae bacterium]|jgi:predicted  nucleic acid-binding Zn-ribbon protein
MSIAELTGQLVDRQKKRTAEAITKYRALVRALAEGNAKTPTAEAVDDLLSQAGKTLTDLQADVAYLAKRREYRRQLDSVPTLKAELNELAEQIDKENTRFAKLKEEHAKKYEPMVNRARQLNAEIGEGESCRLKLAEGYTGPLREESKLLDIQIYDLRRARESKQRWITDLRNQITNIREHPGELDQSQITDIEKTIAHAQAEIEEINKQGAPLAARQREIENAMMQP